MDAGSPDKAFDFGLPVRTIDEGDGAAALNTPSRLIRESILLKRRHR
jgi:hypothetical protein